MAGGVTPQRILLPSLLLGLAMIAIALFIMLLRGEIPSAWYPHHNHIRREILLGLGIGLLLTWAMMWLSWRFPAIRKLSEDMLLIIRFRELRLWQAVILGLLAGIPEEILFRGAIQPVIGLLPTAVLFGVIHSISIRQMVFAGIGGLLLGGVVAWRGDLWAATAIHFGYDALMMLYLRRLSRHLQNIDRHRHQSSVSRFPRR